MTFTMLLIEEIADTFTGPVGAETGLAGWVENSNTFVYGLDDRLLGISKSKIELGRPLKLYAWTEERSEGFHIIAQLGVI